MQQRHPNRKQQILQALAAMLESNAGDKITTAKLAAELEVSEAALYRHFPSKARMYESLLDFVEETIFSRVTAVLNDVQDPLERCYQILCWSSSSVNETPGSAGYLTAMPFLAKTLDSERGLTKFLSGLRRNCGSVFVLQRPSRVGARQSH